MRAAGMEVNARDQGQRGPYSTDFGNVSYVVPSVTGSFAISHEPIPGHSQQVVDASCSEFGYEQLLKVSTAMSLTALDLLTERRTSSQPPRTSTRTGPNSTKGDGLQVAGLARAR